MKLAIKEDYQIERAKRILKYTLSFMPSGIAEEIKRITEGRRDCPIGLSEIRLRRSGISSLVICGESVCLSKRVTESEMAAIFERITGGSLYAFERELRDGYITLEHGIRVGVALSEIKTESRLALALIFRLPLSSCSYADELFGVWQERGGGMLLYSPPAHGKTTALSHLSRKISAISGKRVVIVDERGEFAPEDFTDTTVDIIRGYPKPKGIEIALRALGAEVVVTDEIGNAEEAKQIELSGRGGVPFIASAHASDKKELYSKRAIAPLLDCGFFSTVVRLYRTGAKFGFEVDRDTGDNARK